MDIDRIAGPFRIATSGAAPLAVTPDAVGAVDAVDAVGAVDAVDAVHATGFLGWEAADLPMLLCLPFVLLLSGFFSGSETALFGLSQAERISFRQRQTLAGRAVEALLADPRMLLITILLGNMTINVLYFVVSSVLLIRSSAGGLGQGVMAVVALLVIVLVGEVGPKLVASGRRVLIASLCAPLLLTIHRAIGPLRVVLNRMIVTPLSRLTAPSQTPPELDDSELNALFELSGREGVIDQEEQRMLRDVLHMRKLKVRDVMTPRTRMVGLRTDATRGEVEAATQENRLARIPVYEGDLDHVVGVLQVKRYLLEPRIESICDDAVMTRPHFVPEIASLEQLLDLFRRSKTPSMIVVDEYGGTEGVVAVADVVEELVGDIVGSAAIVPDAPRLVGLGVWLVSGTMSVYEFADAFGLDLEVPSISTVSGLITDALGREPRPGDRVQIDKLTLEVKLVDRTRVAEVVASLRDMALDDPAAADSGEGTS